jgi:hypothetical protein
MGVLLEDLKLARTTNDDFNDVCLIGTDGASIPVSRLILSIRSQVFGKMLYGAFKESQALGVPLLFSSTIIEQVVQYCYYSDEAGAVAATPEFLEGVDGNEARNMVGLRSAADFFGLSELVEAMTGQISSLVVTNPGMACTVLDELSAVGEAEGRLSQICISILRVHGEAALLPVDYDDDDDPDTGVRACSPEVLAKVLSEEIAGKSDGLLARCLRHWETKNRKDDIPDLAATQPNCRRQCTVAREIASRVCLNRVAPSQLSDLMFSGLFTQDAVYEAFRYHALSAEKKGATVSVLAEPSKAKYARGCYIVNGAGSEEVNGVYRKNHACTRDGVPEYILEGRSTFLNQPVTFKLYRSVNSDRTKRWRLNAFPMDGSSRLSLYRVSVDAANPDKPPTHGWKFTTTEDRLDVAAGPPPFVLEIDKK